MFLQSDVGFSWADPADTAMPESVELKLRIDPRLYGSDRRETDGRLARVMAEAAREVGLVFEPSSEDELSDLVCYFDTAEGALAKHHLTLRQKFPMGRQGPASAGVLMLKERRDTPLLRETVEAFRSGLAADLSSKVEIDAVGLADGVPGRLRRVWSVSAKGVRASIDGGRTSDLTTDFPYLARCGCDHVGPLQLSTPPVIALEATIGSLVFADRRLPVTVVLWRELSDAGEDGRRAGSLRLAELSWKLMPSFDPMDRHERLHRRLQDRTDLFEAGRFKTE